MCLSGNPISLYIIKIITDNVQLFYQLLFVLQIFKLQLNHAFVLKNIHALRTKFQVHSYCLVNEPGVV